MVCGADRRVDVDGGIEIKTVNKAFSFNLKSNLAGKELAGNSPRLPHSIVPLLLKQRDVYITNIY